MTGFSRLSERRFLAGQRPYESLTGPHLDFGLFSHLQGIVDFDAEIPDGTLQFSVTEEQLHGPEVLGSPIDQRGLRAPHRMGAVCSRIQTDFSNPAVYDAGVLARRQMR